MTRLRIVLILVAIACGVGAAVAITMGDDVEERSTRAAIDCGADSFAAVLRGGPHVDDECPTLESGSGYRWAALAMVGVAVVAVAVASRSSTT